MDIPDDHSTYEKTETIISFYLLNKYTVISVY